MITCAEVLIEYCQWESFNATCNRGSVVVMQVARYGRMKHGRCADTDVYIGCSADVLSQMDERCSGRQSCTMAIPDSALHQQQPCPNDMMAYLEASFICVRGAHDILGRIKARVGPGPVTKLRVPQPPQWAHVTCLTLPCLLIYNAYAAC